MHRFFKSFLEPLLSAMKPDIVVEIGAESGHHTRLILDFSPEVPRKLHSIDPDPRFDVEALENQHRGRLVFHRGTSLQVLARLNDMDLVLIDGDHNWYSVFSELKLIQFRCRELNQPLPVVLLHDVGWPYGRRDLYYEPSRIPVDFRQAYAQQGMLPGHGALVDSGGFNRGYFNALKEGTPRNGVLTALEDFMEEADESCTWRQIEGLHGLGALVPESRVESNPWLSAWLDGFRGSESLQHHLGAIENDRLERIIELAETRASNLKQRQELTERLANSDAGNKRLQAALEQAKQRGERLQSAFVASREALENLNKRTERIAAERGRLAGRVKSLEESWRRAGAELQQEKQAAEKWKRSLAEASRQIAQRDGLLSETRAQLRRSQETARAQREQSTARIADLEARLAKLQAWTDQLMDEIERHLESWTWRLGSAGVGLMRMATWRKPVAAGSLKVFRLIGEIRRWRGGAGGGN